MTEADLILLERDLVALRAEIERLLAELGEDAGGTPPTT